MKSAQKIVKNLIYKIIFLLKVSSLRQDVWYLGVIDLCQNKQYILNTKSFGTPVSIGLAAPAHMQNRHEVCLNTTNYVIFNMQDFRCWLYTSIVLVSWYPHYVY